MNCFGNNIFSLFMPIKRIEERERERERERDKWIGREKEERSGGGGRIALVERRVKQFSFSRQD